MPEYEPASSEAATKPEDQGDKKAAARFRLYWNEIERYAKETEKWREKGDKIVKLYLDEHRQEQEGQQRVTGRRMCLLWSNVETLKPAVYAKTPTVVVSRRHKDSDPTGRVAAEILERCANTSFDLYDFSEVMENVRDDRLLPGRGQAWVRYEADFEERPETGEDGQPRQDDKGQPVMQQLVTAERVCVDHVDWRDFGHNIARTWKEVWLVFRKVYKTKAEVEDRFGAAVAAALDYGNKPAGDKDAEHDQKACLHEVWDKRRKRMCFLAKGYDGLIDDGDPPLDVHGFFPCPRPALGTHTSKSLIPKADYIFYQDQAEEIDDLTSKIGQLTDWLIVKGFIPGGPSSEGGDALEEALRDASNQEIFVRVESWMEFVSKGGSKLIEWLPLDIIIQALQGAIDTRRQLIEDVYQVTGIADILRGQSDPNETLGAQQLKQQNGSRRVRNTKDELSRFARDICRIVCEVMADTFRPQTLAEMSGYQYVPQMPPEQQQQMQQQGNMGGEMPLVFDDKVIQRMRNDRLRSYSIDVETDSTVMPDEDAEKQRRVEFSTMFGEMLKSASELVNLGPLAAPLVPMVGEAIKFTVRGFRAGRQLEDVIERSLAQVSSLIQQQSQQPPKPSPEEIKAKAEEQKLQLDREKQQQEMAIEQMRAQHEQQMLQVEMQAAEREMQLKVQMAQMELQVKQMEAQLKVQSRQQDMAMDQEQRELDRQAMHEQAAFDRRQRQDEVMLARQQGYQNGAVSDGGY